MDIKKKAMIAALEKSLGIVTVAARETGVSRQTHYDWLATDPEYVKAVDGIQELTLDFAESKLHTQIQDGNTIATIFFLKTKGKRRGYIERTEIDNVDDREIKVRVIHE